MFGLKRIKEKGRQLTIFKSSPLLARLSPLEKFEFIQICHKRNYKAGEYIFHQGDPATGIYLLETGKVDLISQSELAKDDAPSAIVMQEGDSFGMFCVGYGTRRMSSARCINDCTVYGFFSSDFETLRDRHPRIAIKFLEVINIITSKQLEKVTKSLKEKLNSEELGNLLFETYEELNFSDDE